MVIKDMDARNIRITVRRVLSDTKLQVHQVSCWCDELNKGRIYAIMRLAYPNESEYEIECVREEIVREDMTPECKVSAFYEKQVIPGLKDKG